jgi:tryptophanyl-tRNA synthetase
VLRQNIQDVALDFLACGLDTRRTVFFRQSDVPEVLELTWLLSIVTPMGLLERCHSFKDKTTKGIAASHALFSYPVLMAADILEVQATTVPVGRDQKQHVEVARDIAVKFNLQFGETFAIPEPVIREDVAVVPGLDGQKMSKSYNNTIELFGTEKDTKARIMRIVTDSTPLDQPKDPAACHIFALYKLFASDAERAEMDARYRVSGFGYGTAKKALFEKVWSYFEPFRKRREELRKEPAYVEAVLKEGAERARVEARKTLSAARRAVGLE